jgi:hypothetical protein
LKAQQNPADDWLQTLFIKRHQGRRMSPDQLPPYITADGLILIDRRSHLDRRKTLDPKVSTAPALS